MDGIDPSMMDFDGGQVNPPDASSDMVNPPNVSDPSINPGLASYMQMLGMPSQGVPAMGGGTTPGAIPTLPTGGAGAVPGYGAPPMFTLPSWLGLGISGEKAQQTGGLGALGGAGGAGASVNYTAPPVTQIKAAKPITGMI